MLGLRSFEGAGISLSDREVYQIVCPEEPEANGRCCLKGRNPSWMGGGVRVSEAFEVDASGWTGGWALVQTVNSAVATEVGTHLTSHLTSRHQGTRDSP